MFIVNSRKQTEHIEKYEVEGSSNNPPILFKQLKTLCYIGDKKVKGGNVMHISTTIIDDKTFELFHNFSKDMLHVNIANNSKILFDYSNRIYIFVKRNSDLRLTEYVEFGEKKGLIY